MNHIDQQTLELYVLGDKSVLAVQREIESHLDQCAGCRELKARMEDLHDGFASRMHTFQDESPPDFPSKRLRRSLAPSQPHTPLQEVRGTYSTSRSRGKTLLQYAQSRPIATTTSIVLGATLLGFIGLTLFTGTPIDDNPTGYHLNTGANRVEFSNEKGAILWQLMTYPDELRELEAAQANRARFKRIVVADLDEDGKNEIYSMLRPSGGTVPVRSLRVFDGTGVEQHTQGWDLTGFRFREFSYTHSPELTWIQDIQGQPRSIFVKWLQRRSPIVMGR